MVLSDSVLMAKGSHRIMDKSLEGSRVLGWDAGPHRCPPEGAHSVARAAQPLSPQNLFLAFLHPVQEALQLPRPLAVHKALPDAGVQAPGELWG